MIAQRVIIEHPIVLFIFSFCAIYLLYHFIQEVCFLCSDLIRFIWIWWDRATFAFGEVGVPAPASRFVEAGCGT